MSVRFPTLALAVAHTSYRANEDVWIGGGATLGDEVSGYYVFRRDADTPAGPGVIVVPNGRLERTSDPNAQFDALAVRTAERLRPDLNDLEARIGMMELTLSSALINLPAQVAEHLKSGDPLSIAGEVTATGAATAAEVNNALKSSPQPIEGQVALPSDVVNAIGSAVNAAIRDEGALPVAGAGGASASEINDELKSSAQPTRTQVSSSEMIQVQTAADGTSWASFPVAPCQTITIYNQTGVRIRVGLDSSPTIYTVLEPDMGIPLATPNNSSNARVKRDDESTTQVAVTALAVL